MWHRLPRRSVRGVNDANLTALHVLMSNPRVELEMDGGGILREVPRSHHGNGCQRQERSALYYTCYNPHTSVDIGNRCLSDFRKSSASFLLQYQQPIATTISHALWQFVKNDPKRFSRLFSSGYPIKVAQLNSTKDENKKYLVDLTNRCLDELWNARIKLLNSARQHGWVLFR
jgi:hypothetical protein